MGGEDFSFFMLRPGRARCSWLGATIPRRGLIWGHHHPRFDIDEESLAVGLETMALSVLTYLERGFDEDGEA